MSLRSLHLRLRDLEAHAGQRSIDEDGRVVWIRGSGLSLLRAILIAGRTSGKDPRLEDLTHDDQQLVRLWARAEPDSSELSKMIITTCRALVA